MPRITHLRITGLRLADMVMEGTFFLLQIYLTDVWKLNFTTAAAILNIWGGIYRTLPVFFLFLADTFLGNAATLALSGILSTTGLFLVTASALPVYTCLHKEAEECSGDKERGLFITGMILIALGRAARFASTLPFLKEQNDNEDGVLHPMKFVFTLMITAITAIVVNLAFPYAKKWYLLFGVSALYTASATVFFLSGYRRYQKRPKPKGSAITDIFRVFVATAFKISQPSPNLDDPHLYVTDDEEFKKLSSSCVLGFLNKAAIQLPSDEENRSWRLCSVSQVESTKIVIRMVPFWSSFIMCGIVSSTGSTYIVEQINHMNYKIGAWEPPAQVLLSMFLLCTLSLGEDQLGRVVGRQARTSSVIIGGVAMSYSILCCTVAAAVERNRLHVGARHHLLDQPDAKIPMNAGWLFFQVFFLAMQEAVFVYCLTAFHVRQAPKSMKGLQNCIIEGVTGIGFMCSALLVYVVGKISEKGGHNNWFQSTLNRSRLDRYYWVLAALSSVNLLVFLFTLRYEHREWDDEDLYADGAHTDEHIEGASV